MRQQTRAHHGRFIVVGMTHPSKPAFLGAVMNAFHRPATSDRSVNLTESAQ